MTDSSVRVRFAPSNTGTLHLGGARTALYNWLYARKRGGTFVLRIEDTDRVRSTDAFCADILDTMRWLGLDWDEGPETAAVDGPSKGEHGPYFQSERGALYRPFVERLTETGNAYRCFCSADRLTELREKQQAEKASFRGYDRRCRSLDPAETAKRAEAGEACTIRLAVPEGETGWDDGIKGAVSWNNAEIDDLILVRSDGTPTYNLVVVLDDHLMAITDVIRGDDHTSNTPKQILIANALGLTPPRFAHIPLILGPEGRKLSKRKAQFQDGVKVEADVAPYRDAGYPAEAFLNFMALLGWALDDKTEVFTREELIRDFSFDGVTKSGSRLDLKKLEHFAGIHIRAMEPDAIADAVTPSLVAAGLVSEVDAAGDKRAAIVALAGANRERLTKFSDIVEKASFVFGDVTEYDAKSEKNLLKNEGAAADVLRKYAVALEGKAPDAGQLEEQARSLAEEWDVKFGQLVHPIRAALTGVAVGPPIFDVFAMIGMDAARERLTRAAAWVDERRKATESSS